MATETLEQRVAAIELELAQLKRQVHHGPPLASIPWWERIAGSFANSEHYDETMRLGREYRESQQPKDDEVTG